MKDPRFIARHGLSVNTALAACTSIKTGGNADFFVEVAEMTELESLAKEADENSVRMAVIGNGSRVVVSDYGYRGLIVKNRIRFVDIGDGVASLGAGTPVSEVVYELAKHDYGGFEELVSFQGTVGGLLSAGSPATETFLRAVETVSVIQGGATRDMTPEEWGSAENAIILSCCVRLISKDSQTLNRGILTATQQRLRTQPGGVPFVAVFAHPDATSLLDQLDMAGERVGGAIVSKKDPNYIINDRGAKAREVYELAQRMKNRIKVKLGPRLDEAIVWLGEW